jgi:DNA-binding IclR family transcriptional regulator
MRARAGWHILSSMPSAKKRAGNRRKPVDAAVGTPERGLAILQIFKSVPEASVAEVATALDLSRSTTYRIAERLRDPGFLETNSSMRPRRRLYEAFLFEGAEHAKHRGLRQLQLPHELH